MTEKKQWTQHQNTSKHVNKIYIWKNKTTEYHLQWRHWFASIFGLHPIWKTSPADKSAQTARVTFKPILSMTNVTTYNSYIEFVVNFKRLSVKVVLFTLQLCVMTFSLMIGPQRLDFRIICVSSTLMFVFFYLQHWQWWTSLQWNDSFVQLCHPERWSSVQVVC